MPAGTDKSVVNVLRPTLLPISARLSFGPISLVRWLKMVAPISSLHLMNPLLKAPIKNTICGYPPAVFWSTGIPVP